MQNTNPIAIMKKPNAKAAIAGSSNYPQIKGEVYFYQMESNVMVVANITNLPYESGKCGGAVLGFHIHSGLSCTGNETDSFADAMTHYNPLGCPHPFHSGDMPPLFVCKGSAFLTFMTDRFIVREILGRTVIIHSKPDDFTTQPSGNSGEKIACGVIEPFRK